MHFKFFIVLIISFVLALIFFPKNSNHLETLGATTQVINLTNWKLTLPTGNPGKPEEIFQPALETYQSRWFKTDSVGAIHFGAPVNGVTTKRSNYPRSELREMTNNGKNNASWSSKKGTNIFFFEEAITVLPKTKKHIVAGQIHDSKDDILVVRLESSKLWINVNGKNVYLLNDNYKLGQKFSIKFVINKGQSQVFYNESTNPVYILKKNYSGAYFKVGAYPQSNCSKEEKSLCNDQNYGEVVIYNINISHFQ